MKVTHDFETRSEANLTKVGPYQYAKHPSTDILCLSYKIESGKTKLWVPDDKKISTGSLDEFVELASDEAVELHAHNAMFETCINKFVLSRYVAPRYRPRIVSLNSRRFHCSAAKCAAVALPRALEKAAIVLKLKLQKDMTGHRLMKKYAKPTIAWSKWNKAGRVGDEPKKWYDDPFELMDIYDYCINDTEVEYLIDLRLPDLSVSERKIWLINQEMNLRGVQIDIPVVKKIIGFMKDETKLVQAEAQALTDNKISSVNQRDKLIDWLEREGVDDIPNLKAGTVKEILAREDVPPSARRVLEIRQEISKTSNKKYHTMLARAGDDGRVRDIAMYHGASTGRESGSGIQPHNFPKGTIKTSSDFAIDLLKKENDLDFIRFIYGSPFNVFSSCLGGMIVAPPGFEIISADLNAIECRIVNWIAGNQEVIDAFARGEDPYVTMASRIFSLPLAQIDGFQRFLGKIAELACGYQMGKDKFYQTCIDWGAKDVTKALAKKAVETYRKTHQPVVNAWGLVEKAAIRAVRKKEVVSVCKTKWYVKDDFLWCVLPSGRRLAYYKPTVRMEPAPWGDIMPKLYHWQVGKNKNMWVNKATYGGKLVENVVQGIGRDVAFNGIVHTSEANYQYMFQVHDESVSGVKIGKGSVEHYSSLMAKQPTWAEGLPIKAKGWRGPRYKKD